MNKKLINLIIKDVDGGYICRDEYYFFKPKHILIRVYEDGSISTCGSSSLANIDYTRDESFDMKIFDCVYSDVACKFVKDLVNVRGMSEREAKARVLYDLRKSGVVITPDAEEYLKSQPQNN
jgi:hypothetical protein